MKKIIFLLLLITIYVLIFNSCKKKCESNDLGKVSFNATDIQIVPYNGTETLTFTDTLGNSQIFKGLVRGSNYNDVHYQNSYNGGGSPADFCYGNYFATEHIYIQFHSESNLLWIDLAMNGGNPFFQNINKNINIKLGYKDPKLWEFNQGYNFKGDQILNSLDINKSNLSFKDSLKIGNKKYYFVYILEQIKVPYTYPDTSGNLKLIFYTVKEGVVGFMSSDKHTWNLE